MKRTMLAAAFIAAFTATAAANDPWLIVRPGMAVEDHISAWQEKCPEFILSDDAGEENYLTCHPDPDIAVTANIAPSGVAWWSRFWGASDIDRPAFIAHFTDELGLSESPSECRYFNDPAQCWTVGTSLVTIPETSQGGRWTVTMEDRSIMDAD